MGKMKVNADPSASYPMTQADIRTLAEVGVLLKKKKGAGTYVLRNFSPICIETRTEGLEILPIAEALRRYDWLREQYYWKAVPKDLNDITEQCASLREPQGFFARVKKGVKAAFPCRAGMYMAEADVDQSVHNVVIVEEGAALTLITGCVTGRGIETGSHSSITEHYVGKNASLTGTMVHSWGPKVTVRSYSGTIVDEGGTFINNYVSLKSAGDVVSAPETRLNGKGACAEYTTVVLGSEGSRIETGGDVYLNAEGSSAEMLHRGVCTGGALVQKGMLIGNENCRGHVDCAGLLTASAKNGSILSAPVLKVQHPEAQLSHEAGIGRIAPEQVEYLQSRGMEEREAVSMIIRGFLNTDIAGIGPTLDARIAEISGLAGHGFG